jgi:hypothetical protein
MNKKADKSDKAEQHKYSLLSKASYDFYHTGLDKTQEQLDLYPQTRYYGINTDLTNKNSVVLVSPDEVVISYRGTDPKNISDLATDTQVLLGLDKIPIHFVDRFAEADKTYKKVKKEYPNRPITLTGHSLGSTVSVYVGMKNGVNSISFNEGASPLSTVFSQITGNPENYKKQKIYLTGKDILSNSAIFQPYDIQFVPTKQNFNFVAHSLSYFLPEPTDTPLPDWLLPKMKMPKYKPTKGLNYAVSRLVPETQFIKKKKKKVMELEELDSPL